MEDDLTIARALVRQLNCWGYQTEHIVEFDKVLEQFQIFSPDLVLMDITLPFFSGYHWCAEIRKSSQVPIIFISSASDEMNQVMALSMGGDDFVTKPFGMELVVAKIGAVLRRSYQSGVESNIIQAGQAVLDLTEAALHYNGQRLPLSKNEYLILRTLMAHKNAPVSREELIRQLWEDESFIDDNTLTVNITRIRKKLEEIGLYHFILTRKGLGYLVEG